MAVETLLFWAYQGALFLAAMFVLLREYNMRGSAGTGAPPGIGTGPGSGPSAGYLWAGFGGLLVVSVIVLSISDVQAPRLTLLFLDWFWTVLLFRNAWFRERFLDLVERLRVEHTF